MSALLFFIVIVITAILGAGSTYLLALKTNWGGVRSSAFLSLVVGVIFYVVEGQAHYFTEIPSVFIGASFVGMSAPTQLRLVGVLIAGVIFGLLYFCLPATYAGVGGTLGTSACVSVLAVYGCQILLKKNDKKKRLI